MATTGYSAKQYAGVSFADTLSAIVKGGGDSSAENKLDTISFSGASGTPPLLAKSELILPTLKNVKILSSALKDELGNFFRENGISTKPPVELSVNGEGRIVVKTDREDAGRIEDLVNADDTLANDIRTLNAIAGVTYELPRHLQFQAEYRASKNPEAVVAKYSDLFYPRPHTYSLRFGGEDSGDNLELLADGEIWSRTNIPISAWTDESIENSVENVNDTVADTITGLGE